MLTYLKLGLGIALAAAFAWGAIATYHAGKKAGQDAVQTLWDRDKSAIQAVTDAAIAKATKERDDALQNNSQVTNDLQTQLDSLRSLNAGLSKRLRLATSAAAHSGGVSQGDDFPAAITGSTPDSVARLDDAIAAALTECATNRANYRALIKELQPQIDGPPAR